MIEILYCTHNRLEFTRKTLGLLLESIKGTDARVWWLDDNSQDKTGSEMNDTFIAPPDGRSGISDIVSANFGGPVAMMNHFLKMRDYPGLFVKIDNDVALPSGWLQECLAVMDLYPDLDLLGIEPMDEDGMLAAGKGLWRGYRRVDHIGGIGMFRGRAFRKHGLPTAHDRFFGFTKWQTSHDDIVKGWLYPALPIALLDRIPVDPWRSLARSYCEKGWSRPWPPYSLTERREQWEWVL